MRLLVRENAAAPPLARWELVEEKGVRERVLGAFPAREMAAEVMRRENARRAQAVAGTAGTFYRGDLGRPAGCTCPVGGMAVEAVPCPVHDV